VFAIVWSAVCVNNVPFTDVLAPDVGANYIYVDTAANDVIGLTAARVAVGNISPSSRLTIAATAGTGANQGALKFTSSDILATPEAGSVEFYQEKFHITPTSTVQELFCQLNLFQEVLISFEML